MKKHALSTRLWHWINALSVIVLFMSGLNISNAHRYLYWGGYGFDPADAWTAVIRFPGWATIPGHYNLAMARDWHILMAWPFAVGLITMWVAMFANGHIRDLLTRRDEWRPTAIWHDILQHLKLNFDHVGGKYNFLQKLAYGSVLLILLPLMLATGLAISPGFEPAAPWLVDMFGGRQSARSLHFIAAWGLFGFFVIHIVLVALTNPIKQIREMITGGRHEA